jgi:hypothetical protein
MNPYIHECMHSCIFYIYIYIYIYIHIHININIHMHIHIHIHTYTIHKLTHKDVSMNILNINMHAHIPYKGHNTHRSDRNVAYDCPDLHVNKHADLYTHTSDVLKVNK